MSDDNPQVQQPTGANEVSSVEGAPATEAEPKSTEQPQQPAQPEKPAAPKTPAQPPVKTTQEERMWSAIGYIAFLGVVTLAMMPKSDFCKKHASQGIVLFILWFIGLIVLALPITIVSGIGGLVLLAVTILAIIGIVKSISSYEFKLPVLSGLAKMVPTDAIVGSLTGKAIGKGAPSEATQGSEAKEVKQEAPAAEEPKAEEPKAEEPKAEEAKAEEAPAAEEAKAEEAPAAEEAKAEEAPAAAKEEKKPETPQQ